MKNEYLRRLRFLVKSKAEHIFKVNIPNIANPIQHFHIEIPRSSRDYVLVADIVKSDF